MRLLRLTLTAVLLAGGVSAGLVAPASATEPTVAIAEAPEEWLPGLDVPVVVATSFGVVDLEYRVDGQGEWVDFGLMAPTLDGWSGEVAGIRTPGEHTIAVRGLTPGGDRVADETTLTISPLTFADVASAHVFLGQIEWLADTGITTGYTDGDVLTFRPGQPVLREQMAAFLYRFETLLSHGEAPEVTLPTSSPFTDVDPSHTFYREIVWLESTGIPTGYDNGDGTRRFQPSTPVLREQMAAFLCRYDTGKSCADLPLAQQAFADVPESHTFFDAIWYMRVTGLSTGYEQADGTRLYRPDEPVLREQMAAFLYRFVDQNGGY